MPAFYTILESAEFVYSQMQGIATDDLFLAHAHALAVDPRFRPCFAQLADFERVTDVQLTSGGVRRGVTDNPFGSGAMRAFVAPGDLSFGMMRMYEMLRPEGADALFVCRDLEEAVAWLGPRIPPDWKRVFSQPPDHTFD